MSYNHRRLFFTVLSIVLILSFVSCETSKNEDAEEVSIGPQAPGWKKDADQNVEFDWYINFSWYTTPWGKNLISKAITAETGVSINFIVPTGSEAEKLDSMIASDTLPDLITLGWWEAQGRELIENDLVYALNVLADEYDPYFYKVANDDVLEWYKKPDGNIYSYPSSAVTPKDFEESIEIGSNHNFLVRKDIYEAIGSPDMSTPEGFIKAVQLAVEKFPEINGEPLIPIGSDEFNSHGSNSFDQYLKSYLAVPYEKDGKFYDRYTDKDYIEWLKTFRKLNELGYLSNEIFIDKRSQLEEKMANGRYFCLLYQGSDIHESQKDLYLKNPDKIYIATEGPRNSNGDDPILPTSALNGWTVTFVSKNCKNPDRAIQFLSYLISEHGQKRVYLGIEGTTYEEVDGVISLKPEILELLNTNREKFDKIYGADNAYWMLQDNVIQSKWGNNSYPYMAQLKEWTYPYTAYTGQYEIVFDKNEEVFHTDLQIKEEWGIILPKLLLSKSDEEFDEIFADFIDTRKKLGFDSIMNESTKQMQKLKKRLGIN